MDFTLATNVFNSMLALILALSFHEFAHAFVAKLQGDDTAELDGRLTLNPMAHLDPVGSIVFPLVMSIAGGVAFGWAKPVPINQRNFHNQKWGSILVSGAGPGANLLFCTLSVLALVVIGNSGWGQQDIGVAFQRLFTQLVYINAYLAVFNLLPIYPLDGGHLLMELLPYNARQKYEQYIAPYGFMILLALLFIPGGFRWLGAAAMGWIHFSETLIYTLII